MTDPWPGRLYQQQFEYAVKCFEEGNEALCLEEAKKNISDESLPPYYVIRNCMLMACALDNWGEADIWRLCAEQAYRTSLEEATRKNDGNSLEALKDLRKELDELKDFRLEDLTGISRKEIDEAGAGNVDMVSMQEAMFELENEDIAGIDLEDAEALAHAENEGEVAADDALLCVCSARKDPTLNTTHDKSSLAEVGNTTGHMKSLRQNRGGAFHAQQFSKSLRKSANESHARHGL
ncbi:Nn.00g020210.m01.CDS01 [Neocucurbitaria sp. VM-36]